MREYKLTGEPLGDLITQAPEFDGDAMYKYLCFPYVYRGETRVVRYLYQASGEVFHDPLPLLHDARLAGYSEAELENLRNIIRSGKSAEIAFGI